MTSRLEGPSFPGGGRGGRERRAGQGGVEVPQPGLWFTAVTQLWRAGLCAQHHWVTLPTAPLPTSPTTSILKIAETLVEITQGCRGTDFLYNWNSRNSKLTSLPMSCYCCFLLWWIGVLFGHFCLRLDFLKVRKGGNFYESLFYSFLRGANSSYGNL